MTGAGRLAQLDQRADQALDALRGNTVADRAFYAASELGDFSLLWMLIGTARAFRSPRDERAAVRLAAALIAESALVNGLIKSIVGRQRPVDPRPRAHRLRQPRTTSFPSGHASSGFMAAVLLADGRGHGAPYFALAGVVATSRIYVRIHHGSDVVAGAVLGLGLGHLVKRIWPLDSRS